METIQQKQIADYNVYLQLKKLHYSNERIAKHLSYTNEQLGYLISSYSFVNNLEYQIETTKGDCLFNSKFEVTQQVQQILTIDEILEIYNFTKDLVKQHHSIYYEQIFYSIEQDCQLKIIDCKQSNRCILKLS